MSHGFADMVMLDDVLVTMDGCGEYLFAGGDAAPSITLIADGPLELPSPRPEIVIIII